MFQMQEQDEIPEELNEMPMSLLRRQEWIRSDAEIQLNHSNVFPSQTAMHLLT